MDSTESVYLFIFPLSHLLCGILLSQGLMYGYMLFLYSMDGHKINITINLINLVPLYIYIYIYLVF